MTAFERCVFWWVAFFAIYCLPTDFLSPAWSQFTTAIKMTLAFGVALTFIVSVWRWVSEQ